MNFLNAQQLAFILDIKKQDARIKMVHAWCKSKGIKNTLSINPLTKKFEGDDYPIAMPNDILAKELNLPTLQDSVNDIVNNYLLRPATKKWILCDYPEKQIAKAVEEGAVKKVAIPPALCSMLPKETRDTIHKEWKTRFPKIQIKA